MKSEEREVVIKVVDEIMGAGKTSAAIDYINKASKEKKFIVITPYLKEVDRYKSECHEKDFQDPQPYKGTKVSGIKKLIYENCNIVSTHSLFAKFDKEIIALITRRNYTLILDEVTDVIEDFPMSGYDVACLQDFFLDIDDVTGRAAWKKEHSNYDGRFSDIKELCDLGSLACYGENKMLWIFPVEAFKAFKEVYVLTYMFYSQIQRYYFDLYGLKYTYWYVTSNFEFSEYPDGEISNYNYRELIHVCNRKSLNEIGDAPYSLSKTWYERCQEGDGRLEALKKNLYNFFTNVCKGKSSDILWTTFIDVKEVLKGKRYGSESCFLSMNARATNEKKDRCNVAYTVNRFINPIIKQFFRTKGVTVDEDGYALSEMIQFIWRSSVREGNEINVYVPSKRMRKLLMKWIDENSPEERNNEETQ